jgi:hypothetical protein
MYALQAVKLLHFLIPDGIAYSLGRFGINTIELPSNLPNEFPTNEIAVIQSKLYYFLMISSFAAAVAGAPTGGSHVINFCLFGLAYYRIELSGLGGDVSYPKFDSYNRVIRRNLHYKR